MFFDRSEEGVIIVDSEYRIHSVNRKFTELLGYRPEDIIGLSYETLVHPEDRELFGQQVQLRKSGASSKYEIRLNRKDGHALWILSGGTGIFDEGKFVGSIGFLFDITAHKQAEAETRVVSCASRICLTATHVDELVQKIPDCLVRELDFEHCGLELSGPDRGVDHHRRPGKQTFLCLPLQTDGVFLGILVLHDSRKKLIPDSMRTTLMTVSNIVGETVLRLKAEEDLRLTLNRLGSAEARLSGMIDAVPDLIFSVNPSKTLLSFNRAFRHWVTTRLGFEPDETAQLTALLPSDLSETLEEAVITTCMGSSQNFCLVSDESGVRTHWCISSHPMRDRDAVVGVSFCMSNVTEKVLAEEAHELTRAKAIHASRLAEMGEMAAGIAHEINTPLTVISGKAGQLQDLASDGAPLDSASVIRIAQGIDVTAHRIARIVRSLKTVARNCDKDPTQQVGIHSIFEETLTLCSSRFAKSGVELRLPLETSQVEISCRPSQLVQVLLNLLNNSLDAVEQTSEKWVGMELERDEDRVLIHVTDSGPGIPLQLREKIMQPFFTTKGVGKGTGLGLSISKRIIEEHGGRLYLNGDSPHTDFVIELPRRTA